MGHKVKYLVPASSEEFNKLDTKRKDAACEEAVLNIVYRTMHPDTRYWFLHGLSADEIKAFVEKKEISDKAKPYEGVEAEVEKFLDKVPLDEKKGELATRKSEVVKGKDGKPRLKDGVEVTRYTETEQSFYDRVVELLVLKKKFASEDAARAHFNDAIVRIASYVLCDPTEREIAERGPKKLAVRYKVAAAKSISLGTIAKVNKEKLTKIGKQFVPVNDTTKMFAGKYPHRNKDGQDVEVAFNVSDKDAEAYGWLIKEYQDWENAGQLNKLVE